MKKKIYESVWWSTLSVAPTRIINYTTIIILARILTPQIFGEFSYTIIIFQYFSLAENPGLQSAFIYSKKKPEVIAGTFLSLNLIIALSLFISMNITAPLFGAFFNTRTLTVLMRWISISFLFNCSAFVHGAWLAKTMNFKKKLYPPILSSLFSSIIAISMALCGYGVWSLVARHVSMSILNAIIIFLVSGKNIKIYFDRKIAFSLLKYGLPLHITTIIGFLRMNLDYLFVGKLLGTVPLGLYRQAFNAVTLPIYSLSLAVCSIAFPAFSIISSHKEALRDHFAQIFGIQIGFIFLPCFLFIVMPESVVMTFFGQKWIGMIQAMRILAVFIFLRSVTAPFFECYKAKGFLKIRIVLSSAAICMLIPGLILGSQLGISGVALAHLIIFCPFFILEFFLAYRYFGIDWKKLIISNKNVILYQSFILILICSIQILMPRSIIYHHQIVVSIASLIVFLYYFFYMRITKAKAI